MTSDVIILGDAWSQSVNFTCIVRLPDRKQQREHPRWRPLLDLATRRDVSRRISGQCHIH